MEEEGQVVIRSSTGEEPITHYKVCKLNVVPKESFVKFRKEVEGYRVGVNLEFGVGHSFQLRATSWKWKLNTCFGGDSISSARNKTSVRFIPGVNFRFGWKADYVLPEVTGALGTGEPLFNMNCAQLQASLDKVEAIFSN